MSRNCQHTAQGGGGRLWDCLRSSGLDEAVEFLLLFDGLAERGAFAGDAAFSSGLAMVKDELAPI